ncbi:MAG: hypothetical protein JW755_05050 [Candidatus Aminicenantes bacterium]|nr:hypothetical protein [Candidatus Aminicenantes bacterium]
MKYSNNKQHFYSILSVTGFLCLWLVLSSTLQAGTDKKTGNNIRKRFSLEFFGGYGSLNPLDLNLFVGSDSSYQNFVYDSYFDYLESSHMIESWTKSATGSRRKIKYLLPFGIRLRYEALDFLAFSFGFQYLHKKNSDDIFFQYNRDVFYDEEYIEELDYNPYGLSVSAYLPTIGFHVFKQFGEKVTAEVYALGGVLLAECAYTSSWDYTWFIQGQGYTWLTYQSSGLLEYEGSGTGMSVEAGGRISLPVFNQIGFFVEGGYAYQVVSSIAGSGREINGGYTEEWEGDWKIKTETLQSVWGTIEIKSPTNYQTGGDGFEDFKLDLSGFRLRIGFSFFF